MQATINDPIQYSVAHLQINCHQSSVDHRSVDNMIDPEMNERCRSPNDDQLLNHGVRSISQVMRTQ